MKWPIVVPIFAVLLGLAPTGDAGEIYRHSGSIVSIAPDARTFVLAEVGPWKVQDGVTVVTRQTIWLAPETEFAIVARIDEAPSGFPGDFAELQVGPERVYLNDYVTVECRHDGKRMVALKITVIAMPAPETGGGIR